MSEQIIWTALPHGIANGRLRLSVLISPRLSGAGTLTLHDFPTFQDWPAIVRTLHFTAAFDGGPTLTATPLFREPHPAKAETPNSSLWKAIFPLSTAVTSYAFDDYSQHVIRSAPVARVHDDLKGRFLKVAHAVADAPHRMPDSTELLTHFAEVVPGAPLLLGYSRVLKQQTAVRQLLIDAKAKVVNQIDGTLKHQRALKPHQQVGGIAGDYQQIETFHQPRQARDTTAGASSPYVRKPLPSAADYHDQIDFHHIVSMLGNYPQLATRLGLVIDLELPLDAAIPRNGAVQVICSTFGSPPNIHPRTRYLLDGARFEPLPRPNEPLLEHGMLQLNAQQGLFDVVQIDVNGAAEKTSAMVANLAYSRSRNVGFDGIPPLRSAGLSLVHSGRASELATIFLNATQRHQDAQAHAPVELYAEDLIRGYVIDTHDSQTNAWHSLCKRRGAYHFERTGKTLTFDDEGAVTLAITSDASGSSTDLYLQESMFQWQGWSLVAPRPGKAIAANADPANPKGITTTVTNTSATQAKLAISFKALPGSLPRLRFGVRYRFRARSMDLAGHTTDPSSSDARAPGAVSVERPYLRWEPVASPAVVPRNALNGSPAEAAARLVIRSDVGKSVEHYYAEMKIGNRYAERHIVPPKAGQLVAEQHGKFDVPPPAGKNWFEVIVSRDASFETAADGISAAHYDAEHVATPYLPDPLAAGAAFRDLPGTIANQPITTADFAGKWPDNQPFRLKITGVDEHTPPKAPHWNAAKRVLTVQLPQAAMLDVNLSSTLDHAALDLLGIWSWLGETRLAGRWKHAALEGQVWMATPFTKLTLVHAVQHPLITPKFTSDFAAYRQLGATSALLIDPKMPIDGPSTVSMNVSGHWYEPFDDIAQPAPQVRSARGAACHLSVQPHETAAPLNPAASGENPATLLNTHQLGDTRHRRVAYTASATSRFREYFPFSDAQIAADPSLITVTGTPGALHEPNPQRPVAPPTGPLPSGVVEVPSTARPDIPKLLYIVPTFGWEASVGTASVQSVRHGGSLRVYLERPWFSSGEDELLGVVFSAARGRHGTILRGSQPDPAYCTEWGLDPIHLSADLPAAYTPSLSAFTSAVRTQTGLSLSDAPKRSASVAGHLVAFDPDRRLWYSDITIAAGQAYFPFIRLALARYQPFSVDGAHLSPLVLADFMQLTPDRTATVTFDPVQPGTLQISVSGPVPFGSTNVVVAAIEQQAADAPDPDLGWATASSQGAVVTLHLQTHRTILARRRSAVGTWSGSLQAPTSGGRMRLVLREYESYPGDTERTTVLAKRNVPQNRTASR
ncbi:MAG: hypothetical protein JWO42_3142 [Chloroflexi bacterium]|nr:hypothetical protein [Chloroflexota bacterium]